MELFLQILEIVGVIFGLLYVILAARENKWCWPAGLVFIAAYGTSCYYYALYGEVGLQVIYLGLTLYGWQQWRTGASAQTMLPITKTAPKLFISLMLLGSVLTVGLFFLLKDVFGGSYPFWDALTSAFSLVATWMVAKKKIENWLLWLVIDVIYIFLFFFKGLNFYSFLYGVYCLLAVWGYLEWRKNIQIQYSK